MAATLDELEIPENLKQQLDPFAQYVLLGFNEETEWDWSEHARNLLAITLVAADGLAPRRGIAVSCAQDNWFEDSRPDRWFYLVRRPDRDGRMRLRIHNMRQIETWRMEFEGDRLMVLHQEPDVEHDA